MEWAMLGLFGQSVISIFAIVNPVGNLPVFVGLTQDTSMEERRKVFRLAGMVAMAIVVVMALLGQVLLEYVFHIGMNEFAFAGGVLLMLIGIKSILAGHGSSGTRGCMNHEQRQEEQLNLAISPIAIPLLCGPGSIVTAMLLVTRYGRVFACLACLVTFLFVILFLNYSHYVYRLMGKIGSRAIGRVMQIFIISIGVKFCFTALSNYFAIFQH